MRRLSAAGLAGLLVAVLPAGDALAASSPGLTRVESPRADQVIGNGRAQVVIRSRAGLGALRVSVDGRNIKRHLRRSGGAYRAQLRLGRGLHYGVNYLLVSTRGSADFDRVPFIVARRVPDLLSLRDLDVGGREAPVRVEVRAGRHTTLRAWVNGHRVDHAFHPQGRAYVGRLGADDGVRPGRNRLVVLAHRAHRSGRSAVHDVESTTFRHRPGRVIAGAGRDRVVDAGDLVELRGSALGAGGDRDYRWSVANAPRDAGDDALLEDAETATPEFVATTPGRYHVRTNVSAANGTSSADTVTVTARADVPPIGWRLDTTDAIGTMRLNGAPVPYTGYGQCVCPFVTYAIYDRQTLEFVDAGNRQSTDAGLKAIADLASSYNRAPSYLMIVNLSALVGMPADAERLFTTLGVKVSGSYPATPRPVSIVGVPARRRARLSSRTTTATGRRSASRRRACPDICG